ncbi:MAG: hypothetical protein CVT75_08185 [Alphaproteobacteria bacterium HGW-Alphaproteobacteria-14]|nr:MAG: hypothetical protein CVT75_08185 [Alphaproteobacteria bacterium HGW-Alphaproteobacteria-14]
MKQDRGLKLPLYLATTLFYLLLIPEQANVNLGGLLFSPYRLFLIPTFLYLFQRALQGGLRFVWLDLLVALACAWIWLASYMSSDSLVAAIVQGGAHTMDIALPYFVARFAIRSPQDLRVLLVLIAPGVAVMGAVVMLESILGRHLIQPFLASITGNPSRLGLEARFGLTRGAASFPHPILAGICLASFLTLYLMSGIRGWPKLIGAAGAVASFFTLSSAALLGLVVGGFLLAYDWLVQRVSNLSWRLMIFGMTVLYMVVELTSTSGFFNLLVRYASLNTASAYNRVLIWDFGTQSVARHPLFGIGYADWERPDWMQWSTSFSVDHFWLLLAMRFGLPTSLLLIFATAGAVILVSLRSMDRHPVDARLLRGVAISLAVFALGAVSVALWLNALVWFFMLLGIAVSLGSNRVMSRSYKQFASYSRNVPG